MCQIELEKVQNGGGWWRGGRAGVGGRAGSGRAGRDIGGAAASTGCRAMSSGAGMRCGRMVSTRGGVGSPVGPRIDGIDELASDGYFGKGRVPAAMYVYQ